MVLLAQRLCVLPAMEGVRWAFPCGTWLPSRAEWLLAVRSIQPEEKERIGQFVFARDAKAALAGRLMIRKLVAEKLNIPWNNIRLQRTAKGKPVLAKDSLNPYPNFNFNISHQGDYAVLAAESELQVGIDIMKTSFPAVLGVCSCADFSLVAESRGYSSRDMHASHCSGFSCYRVQASVIASHGLSSCGAWT